MTVLRFSHFTSPSGSRPGEVWRRATWSPASVGALPPCDVRCSEGRVCDMVDLPGPGTIRGFDPSERWASLRGGTCGRCKSLRDAGPVERTFGRGEGQSVAGYRVVEDCGLPARGDGLSHASKVHDKREIRRGNRGRIFSGQRATATCAGSNASSASRFFPSRPALAAARPRVSRAGQAFREFHGPQIANVMPGRWMFTNKVAPSAEKHAPANSPFIRCALCARV